MGRIENELIQWFIKERVPPSYTCNTEYRFCGPAAIIDLWVESSNEVWIVEAEKDADYYALGQLLYYKYLYEDEKMPKQLTLVLLYRNPTAYTIDLFGRYGIRLETPS